MALVLPRRLAPVLPTTYSPRSLPLAKAHAMHEHSGFPYHTFVYCRGFAPAAPRRARTLVSVSFWGPPLPWPLRIIGLVGRYLTNYLIRRSLILGQCGSNSPPNWMIGHSRIYHLSGIILSFPRLFPSPEQIDYVLLSPSPRPEV